METVNAKEAAKQLGISYRTLRKMIKDGSIEHTETAWRGGVNYLIPVDEIARYIPKDDILLSTQDAADAMGVHRNTVYYMIKVGKLKALPTPTPNTGTGKYTLVRVAASEVKRYLAGLDKE